MIRDEKLRYLRADGTWAEAGDLVPGEHVLADEDGAWITTDHLAKGALWLPWRMSDAGGGPTEAA